MKLALEYINDTKGNPKMVQLPVTQWKRIVSKLEKYEQALKIKDDLTEAFDQVERMRKVGGEKKTLSSYQDEL